MAAFPPMATRLPRNLSLRAASTPPLSAPYGDDMMPTLSRARQLLAIILLTILAAGSPALADDAAEAVTVYPRANDAYLINPGKGWIIYSAFHKASDAAWAKASVGYIRITWRQIHTGDNTFDWTPIDKALADCQARGKQLAFGIMMVSVTNPDSSIGLPQWVIDAGAPAQPATLVPDCMVPAQWDHPIFMAKVAQFVTALAERYNGHPGIAFIDLRTYGNWGEGHLGKIGGKDQGNAVKKQFIDQWAAFDKTHIIIPVSGGHGTGPGEYGLYGRDTYGFGGREDSSEVMRRWKTCLPFLDVAPAVAEWSAPYGRLQERKGWTKQPWKDRELAGQILGSHYSYQPLGQWNGNNADTFLAEKGALVDEWQNKMGYWYKMTVASYPRDLANGSTGTLTFSMRNDGVAPFYPRGEAAIVKAALLNDAGEVLATTTLADQTPFAWKPGKTTACRAELTFPATPGATKIAIGVFSRASLANPDIKLGIDHGTDGNWYVLSDMPTEAAK